jgi:hypothetical protein
MFLTFLIKKSVPSSLKTTYLTFHKKIRPILIKVVIIIITVTVTTKSVY